MYMINTLGTENVDEKQIDTVYDKAHLSVELVRLYDNSSTIKYLRNISTIANLSNGVYGLYNSSENQKVIQQEADRKIRFKFNRASFRLEIYQARY